VRRREHEPPSHLLPRFHRRALEAQDRTAVARALADSGERAPAEHGPVAPGAGLHADTNRLRGIPVVGGAVGTSPGTDPVRELLRRDAASTS